MAEISSARAELVEKVWGAQLALPLQEAGSFSYRGGAVEELKWKAVLGKEVP